MTKKQIHSLRLVNFKAFTNQLFELKPLTLLSGFNSTGKSCVLQSILLLRQSYQQGLLSETGLALNGKLVCIGTGQDALNDLAKDNFIGFDVTWNDDTKGIWRFQYNMQADVLNSISPPVVRAIYSTNIFTSNFFYLSSCKPNYQPDFEILEQLEEGSLVLLEHPEHKLHSHLQTKLGEQIALCANRGVQVIIETHSDHILNGIRLAVRGGKIQADNVQLYYFQRIDKQDRLTTEVVSPRIDCNGRIDRWEEGFFDEWDKVLEKLLTPAS